MIIIKVKLLKSDTKSNIEKYGATDYIKIKKLNEISKPEHKFDVKTSLKSLNTDSLIMTY